MTHWVPVPLISLFQSISHNNLTPLFLGFGAEGADKILGVFDHDFSIFLHNFRVWWRERREIMCAEGALDVKRLFLASLGGRGVQEGRKSV